MATELYSIGHSTHSLDDFIHILRAHKIDHVVDIRGYPYSSFVPHFNKEPFNEAMIQNGFKYQHLPDLAGRRKPKRDSKNDAWRSPAFRGYADYALTSDFARGLDTVNQMAKSERVVLMCAEAVPWRCHRNIVGDYEQARGVKLRHIISDKNIHEHKLTPFGRIDDSVSPPVVRYPASADTTDRKWDPAFESAKKKRQRAKREARQKEKEKQADAVSASEDTTEKPKRGRRKVNESGAISSSPKKKTTVTGKRKAEQEPVVEQVKQKDPVKTPHLPHEDMLPSVHTMSTRSKMAKVSG